jgi:hypothetical protein
VPITVGAMEKVAWENEKASSREKVWDIIENLEENEEA